LLRVDEHPVQTAYQKQVERSNQDYMDSQMMLQKEERQKQDTSIQHAIDATERIHGIAADMGDELELQNQELEDFEQEVEQTASLLRRTSHRMEKLMSIGGDTGKIICIVVLVLVIVGILVLMFAV
jgi:hypothetical protein